MAVQPGAHRCLLAIPSLAWRDQLRQTLEKAASAEGYDVVYVGDLDQPGRLDDARLLDLDRLDLLIVDVSLSSDRIAAAVGFATAKGCRVLAVTSRPSSPMGATVFDHPALTYSPTRTGLVLLSRKLRSQLRQRNPSARRDEGYDQQRLFASFAVNWEKLDPRDIDNLVRELLMQLGFERIDWNTHPNEIDLTAELTRKDPDGSSFRELWLISLGRHHPL